MKTLKLEKIDENVFYEQLDNGLDVYYYKSDKSKNFYITLTVKYGSDTLKYKNSDKKYEILPGSAHFLEHKVMNFNNNKKIFNRLNEIGSFPNAYTTYDITNYNIFGTTNIEENILLLCDIVFNPIINKENVENEKGIISEEIKMTFDNINALLFQKLNQNLFSTTFIKDHILGTHKSINNMKYTELLRTYKTFYNKSNMFLVVVGSFDQNKISQTVNEYFKNDKYKKSTFKKLNDKEPDKVNTEYEEISSNIHICKVGIGIKISMNNFKDLKLKTADFDNYILLITNCVYADSVGDIQDLYKNKIVETFTYSFKVINKHLILYFSSDTNRPEEYIKFIKEYSKKYTFDEETFERKKRALLSTYILTFDDNEAVEDYITSTVSAYNKLYPNYYSMIKNLKYSVARDIASRLDNENISIVRLTNE